MSFSLGKLLGRKYEPLNKILISSSGLRQNYENLALLNKDLQIAPVLKSNAYGHGIGLIGKELERYDPAFFCVDSLAEAYELMKERVRTRILVMGCFDPKSMQTKKLPFSFAVFTKAQVLAINKYQPQAKIHVFVDTGMHREGVKLEGLRSYLAWIKNETELEIEGLMSHFAMAEKPKDRKTLDQVKAFEKAQEIVKSEGLRLKWTHIANSSGLFESKKLDKSLGNVARVGIALYGVVPEASRIGLRPVLEFSTKIVDLKELNKGEAVGYDFSYTVQKKMQIAVLPVGYNDGVSRGLSNKGFVKVSGVTCPIIGWVSMNITVIDVSKVEEARIGQKVVIYSKKAQDRNSVLGSARLASVLPYEILVGLDASTRRELVT